MNAVERPNPSVVGDPWWGTPRCRVCRGYFHHAADMVREAWWKVWRPWAARFVHRQCRPDRVTTPFDAEAT